MMYSYWFDTFVYHVIMCGPKYGVSGSKTFKTHHFFYLQGSHQSLAVEPLLWDTDLTNHTALPIMTETLSDMELGRRQAEEKCYSEIMNQPPPSDGECWLPFNARVHGLMLFVTSIQSKNWPNKSITVLGVIWYKLWKYL